MMQRKKKNHRRKFSHHLLLFFIFSFLLLNLPVQNIYSVKALSENYTPSSILPLPTVNPVPVMNNFFPTPNLTAVAVIAIDVKSGIILYEKNSQQKLFPASTTKIMTALTALDFFNLNDVVTIKKIESDGQSMGLVPGEKITAENLLYGILVHSANDAAFVLADSFSEGREGFVRKMNQKAVSLHLTNTHFTNPAGFDDPNHFTTAEDLARLTLFALHNPVIRKIVGITQITVADVNYIHFHPLKNINELLGKIPGVSGFKTGYTEGAGQSLVATVIKDNHEILTVVLNSEDRFKETEMLLNWLFSAVTWQNLNPETENK